MSLSKFPVIPRNRQNLSLSALKKNADLEADLLAQGLSVAPNLSPTAPCFLTLPIHFQAFVDTYDEIARRQHKTVHALLRAEKGKLLESIVAIANSIWTPEQKKTFGSCRCVHHTRPEIRSFDQYCYQDARSYRPGFGPLHETIFQVFKVIANVAGDIKLGKGRAIKFETDPEKHSRWPSSASQFIPNGPTVAVSAFVTWAQLIENAKPLHALCGLSYCCPSLGPVIAENREIIPLVASLLSQLTDSIRGFSPDAISYNFKRSVERDLLSFHQIFLTTWFLEQLAVTHTDRAYISALRSIYGTLSDLVPIIDHYTPAPRQQAKNLFGKIGWCIYQALAPIDALIFHPLFAAANSQGEADIRTSELTGLTIMIILLRNQPNCTLLSCIQTNEDPQVHFKRCGGCNAVWYCSKTCQKEDWKIHKAACRHLKGLLPIAFLTVRENPDNTLGDRARIVSEGAQAIGLTDKDLVSLRKYLDHHLRSAPVFDSESEEVDSHAGFDSNSSI